MGWTGLDLINDFSAELGDTSSAFKTKVLRWINEGVKDIATSHQWPFLREKGKVVLTADLDTHPITLSKPSAPTVAALAGGSLALLYEYKVLVTFYEGASEVESIAGTPSAGITPLTTDLSIDLTAIPISTNPLVTARKIYVSKGGGAYSYYSTITDNTTLVGTVTADTTSQYTPPEEDAIFMIDGDLYIEGSRILQGTSLQDLIYKTNSSSGSGSPSIWAPVNEEEVRVFPAPSSDTTASFHYFKLPAKIFGLASSTPQMPSWLYEDVRRYVMWRGYEFRDRAGKESKQLNYEQGLRITISRKGKALKKSGKIRSVTPDSDGYIN
jgi:hypothetical protein